MNELSKDMANVIHLDTAPQRRSIDSMVFAFTEHCRDGGPDFIDYLSPWKKGDALETINDAVQRYTPEKALEIIKKELDVLFEIGAKAHRDTLEWEGVE